MTIIIKHSKTSYSGNFRMVDLKNLKRAKFRETMLKITYAEIRGKVDARIKSAVTMGNHESETKYLTTLHFSKRDRTEWRRVEIIEALNTIK